MEWYKQIRDRWFIVGHDPEKWETFGLRLSREAIEKQCTNAAEAGCNSIQSSFAHYRWNFLEHVDRISQFIGDLCEIAHRYDLHVWEHHSVVLAFQKFISGIKYKNWHLDQLTKIDLRHGGIYESPRGTAVLCCSNPYFKEAYFGLAKRFVIDHPVDLYMPDDMAWGDDYYECGCQYCRALFKQSTGFTLPQIGDLDKSFYGNMLNPAWRAWIRFRSTKVALFLAEVKEYLAANGKADLPVTTCNSDCLQTFTGRIQGCDHEEYNSIGQLDIGSHEVWCGESMTYNAVRIFVDQSTSQAIGDQLGIPYYAYNYPQFNDEAVFSSARNLAVGMGSCSWGFLDNENYSVLKFVEKFSDKLFGTQAYSNVAVVFSRNSRDLYGEDIQSRSGMEPLCDEFGGWCEGLIRMNLPFKIITESFIENEDISRFKVIILPNSACMSQAMAAKIESYVNGGGKVVATHECSLFDAQGQKLDNFQLSKVFGLNYYETRGGLNYPVTQNYLGTNGGCYGPRCTFISDRCDELLRNAVFKDIEQKRISHYASTVLVKPDSSTYQVLAHAPIVDGTESGFAVITYNKFGAGSAMYFAGMPGLMNNTRGVHWYELMGEGLHFSMDERLPVYQQIIENTINLLMEGQELVTLDKKLDNLLIALKEKKGSYYLHLLNLPVREFDSKGCAMQKFFPESTFDINAGTGQMFGNPYEDSNCSNPKITYNKVPELVINVSKSLKCTKAQLITFDSSSAKALRVVNDEQLKIFLPQDAFNVYAVVELTV